MMLTPFLFTALFAIDGLTAASVQLEAVHFRAGDNPAWLKASAQQSGWLDQHPETSGEPVRQWWTRLTFSIDESYEDRDSLAIFIYTLASYEAYWDGVPIGVNGLPGEVQATEQTGSHLKLLVVPARDLEAGSHHLHLRMSSWRSLTAAGYFKVVAGPLGKTVLQRLRNTVLYSILLALVLAAGIWFLAYRNRRDRHVARFGWLCLAVAVLLVLEQGKHVVAYPYSWHTPRLIMISTVTMIIAWLLPWFLLARFRLSARGYLLAAGVPVMLMPVIFLEPDTHCYWMFVYSLAFSLVLCGRAAWLKREGWPVMATVIGVCLLLATQTGARFADTWFFPAFLIMVMLLAARLIWETKAWRKALITEKLTSSRLELGLLRKSIQPHFLKNTLAAAHAWFEENPAKGSELLAALADELDCFFRIGDRDRIDMEEELILCRQHLKTMRYLLDREVLLEVDAPEQTLAIPPGLLINGVENALTHGRFDDERRTIHLNVQVEGSRLRIELTNPAVPGNDRRVAGRRGTGRRGTGRRGTGTRYLESLLRHHFPGAWQVDQGFDQGFWRLVITIDPFSNQPLPQQLVTTSADGNA